MIGKADDAAHVDTDDDDEVIVNSGSILCI
jgi:hypothetical protein